MVAAPTRAYEPLTYKDLETLPDDGNRYELLEGDLIVSPAPGLRHQVISGRLFKALDAATESSRFGMTVYAPFSVRFSASNVVEPDLMAFRVDQYHQYKGTYFEGAPAFVIEILSPGSSRTDHVRKATLYMENGVEEYWIVEPQAKRILVHLTVADEPMPRIITEGRLESATVPGFSVELAALFAPELKIFE